METPMANTTASVMGVEENEKTHSNQMSSEASAPVVVVSPYALGWSKRLFDLFFSLVVLPIALILTSIVFLLYPFMDGFSVLFRHERVGVAGKKFDLYKIRTYKKSNPTEGLQDNCDELVVVPLLGNLLRMSRIDELPQIWNILKGDMSWVGPRPEQSQFVDKIIAEYPNYDARHAVKPGITGLAQINNPNATIEDHQEKLIFDLEYVQKASLLLDLKILWRSLVVVLTKK